MKEDFGDPVARAINASRLRNLLEGTDVPAIGHGAVGGEADLSDAEKKFDDFLSEEYRNIASAHFNTNATINSFSSTS
ncbi:MAG: hypothetical protein KY475_12870 [Planctomycetes bacterium]|nr:hypothetical protein [Planctomycetota bacterium]